MSGSKLLEQAIVDAQALRDAAFKSAQATLLEKYAPQIKEAVQQLLEQEPKKDEEPDPNAPLGAAAPSPSDALAGGQSDAPTTDFGGSSETSMGKGVVAKTAEDLPASFTGKEKLCACPDDDEEIEVELDLTDLSKKLSGDDDTDDESYASGVEGQPANSMQLEESLFNESGDVFEDAAGDTNMVPESAELEEEIYEEEVFEQAENMLDEIDLDEVFSMEEGSVEEVVKLTPAVRAAMEKSGKKPSSGPLGPTGIVKLPKKQPPKEQPKKDLNESKVKDLLNASSVLLKEVENKDVKINKLLEENNKLSSTVEEMSAHFKKLEEVNLVSARLFYENQVLKSASLNERQKTHIVEAISKADSVNEAKTVYETLINSVGGPAKEERSPKSLNEAISKASTFRLPHKQTEQLHDPSKDRWLKLAGIK
jgi:hypothetical protein